MALKKEKKMENKLASVFDSEISNQIKFARENPRDIKKCLEDIRELATMNMQSALSCFYAIYDRHKAITGVSVRLAEIIVASWTNVRAGARIIRKTEKEVVIQGYIYDLQTNTFITIDLSEPLLDRNGRIYNSDLMTARINATSSIAFRNAVFKAIPSAIFSTTLKDIENYIIKNMSKDFLKDAIEFFTHKGISIDEVCTKIQVNSLENLNNEKLLNLQGMVTAIKEGDTTIECLFNKKTHKTKFEKAFDLAI